MNTTLLLKRAKLWTLAAAVAAALVLNGRVGDDRFVFGVLGSAVWAVLSFWVVEGLVRLTLVPPGSPRRGAAIARLIAAKVALYGVAFWVLLAGVVPPLSCVLGFSLLLIVLVVLALVGKPALRFGSPAE